MAIERPEHSRNGSRRRYPEAFPVRCTHEEKLAIFARAEQANRSASRFLVELALRTDTLQLGRRSSEEISLLEGLMVQLRRVGTNLAELAHRADASAWDEADPLSEAEVHRAVGEVREMLARMRPLLL